MLTTWLSKKGGSYVVVQFILFVVLCLAPPNISAAGWPASWRMVGTVLGSLLMLYGAIMLFGGLAQLGLQLQAVPLPKESATLKQNGVYSLVRHPIYSGLIFGWLGWGLFHHAGLTALLVLLLLLPFFDIKTRREEQMLTAKFSDYPAYKATVAKLIPFIY